MGKRVAIIGAGPAGAATAIALKRQGFEPTLYDKADSIEPNEVGGGFSLYANGLKVLKHLDLIEAMQQFQDNPILEMSFMLIDGSDGVSKKTDKEGEMQSIHVLRSRLYAILMETAKRLGIETYGSKKIKNLVQTSDDVTVEFEDGSTIVADFVVGADGIHSVTRRLLFPDAPRPEVIGTGYVGVFDIGTHPDGTEVGFEHRAGIYSDPLNSRLIFTSYCGQNEGEVKIFQLDPTKPVEGGEEWRPYTDLPKESALLADEIASWGTPSSVVNCVRHAKRFTPVNLYDLPDINSFHKGRVILVGDAAHGTVPAAGQGVNQAFEDAGVLADLLGHFQDKEYERAFELYDQIRIPRSHLCAATARTTFSRMKASNSVKMMIGRFMMKLAFMIMRVFGFDDEVYYHDYRDDVAAAVPGIEFK